MDCISEEEYALAIEKIEDLKNKLIDLRMEHANCNDVKKQELIYEKIKIIKREMSRTKNDIKLYDWLKRKERMK